MKNKNTIYLALAFILLISLSSIGLAQAHSPTTINTNNQEYEDMDEMHEIMIQQFEPSVQEEMNKMHSFCQGG